MDKFEVNANDSNQAPREGRESLDHESPGKKPGPPDPKPGPPSPKPGPPQPPDHGKPRRHA